MQLEGGRERGRRNEHTRCQLRSPQYLWVHDLSESLGPSVLWVPYGFISDLCALPRASSHAPLHNGKSMVIAKAQLLNSWTIERELNAQRSPQRTTGCLNYGRVSGEDEFHMQKAFLALKFHGKTEPLDSYFWSKLFFLPSEHIYWTFIIYKTIV